MVVSADPAVTRRIRLLRNQGMERQYENEIAGLNNRMTDLAAAIGRVQLRGLDASTEKRITARQPLPRRDGGHRGAIRGAGRAPRLPPVHRPQ